jgi:VIT1/CCC1 family predicted Fe2+/Mn2+ transporter
MTRPNLSPKIRAQKADAELLFKSVLCALIGLAVLLSPSFMASSAFRSTVASASLAGWFALVLGCAFGVLYAVRRMASTNATGHGPR